MTPTHSSADLQKDEVRARVREGYSKVAREGGFAVHPQQKAGASSSCCGGGGCCGPAASVDDLAASIGYTPDELRSLPEGANMGLSCGNPGAIAALRPGEVVLDLGSGGGFDAFLAGPKVGASGRVIGVDMTPDMLSKARKNGDHYTRVTGLANVEFRLGEIEALPVADASVDVVISNCVLNLSPDQPRVWKEIARVLKPGGRVAVTDLALKRPLPESIGADVEALVGCIAGAKLVDDIRRWIGEAGLADARFEEKPEYVRAMAESKDPLYRRIEAALPPGTAAADFVASMDITARKR